VSKNMPESFRGGGYFLITR